MALYLVTGQPGHGKTAYALDKAFQFQKEGRSIYAHGVKDLDYGKAGWTYLEDPKLWEKLPDGAVVLLDECYTVFPNRNPGAAVPAHVQAMATHRHRGFDFIMIAQQGLQLDPFLRGLYEEHVHVRQTSIMRSKTKLKRWNQYQTNVQVQCTDVVDWVRPKYVFDYYTSTTLVTTKRTMPMWMRWLILGVVFLLALLLFLRWHFQKKIDAFEQPIAASPYPAGGSVSDPSAAGAGAGTPAVTYASTADYAKAHLPRIGTMPWTAPIYDQRAITTDPQLICMSSMEGLDGNGNRAEASCSCMTEQGTRYELSQPECRTLARNGPVYNPYKVQRDMASQGAIPPLAQPGSTTATPQPHATGDVIIGVQQRPMSTFPESAQNRYGGGG